MDTVVRLPPYKVESIISASEVGQVTDWGLVEYGVPAAWSVTKGAGAKVAVLDTGVQIDHPDLGGQFGVEPADFTGSPYGADDRQGHGTHCAGVVAASETNGEGVIGVAPLAKLYVGKVLGDDGSGSGSGVARGLDWAREQGVAIISMSLGSPQNDPQIAAAVARATSAGIFVICAAGNSGPWNPQDIDYPGRLDSVLAVASVGKNGVLSQFSSRGPHVAIAAPGEQILSTIPTSRYGRLSGTSMATPFVAGVTALLVARHLELGSSAASPLKTRADLLEHLKEHAKDAAAPGFDTGTGWGVVKVDELLKAEQPTKPPGAAPGQGVLDLGVAKIYTPARAGDLFSVGW